MPGLTNKPDIIAVLESHGIDLKKRGAYYWAQCPFHQEKTPSFKVDPERQSYHCFGCGESGDSITFIQKHDKRTFMEVMRDLGLAQRYSGTMPARQIRERQLVAAFRKWESRYHADLCTAYRMLQKVKRAQLPRDEIVSDKLADLYKRESIWAGRMEILEGRDEEAKFKLYEEVNRNGNWF